MNTWAECSALVTGYAKARFKKFDSEPEAKRFIQGDPSTIRSINVAEAIKIVKAIGDPVGKSKAKSKTAKAKPKESEPQTSLIMNYTVDKTRSGECMLRKSYRDHATGVFHKDAAWSSIMQRPLASTTESLRTTIQYPGESEGFFHACLWIAPSNSTPIPSNYTPLTIKLYT